MSLLDHPTAQALLADAEVPAVAVADCRRRLDAFLRRYLPRIYYWYAATGSFPPPRRGPDG